MHKKGFTFIEILAVILIISILVAVSFPFYRKAVLKSRYGSLALAAKPIAEAQETFYMANGTYATDRTLLDISLKEENEEERKVWVSVSDKEEYKYVLATRLDLANNFIIYQDYSPNFPGEIHCEAKADDELANWLCEYELEGKRLPGSLTEGYIEYVVQGEGNGTADSASASAHHRPRLTCSEEETAGYNTCTVTDNEGGSSIKEACVKPYSFSSPVCTSTVLYDNDFQKTCTGTYTSATDTCAPKKQDPDNPYEIIENADGNIISESVCKKWNSSSSQKCRRNYTTEYTYDPATGHVATSTETNRNYQDGYIDTVVHTYDPATETEMRQTTERVSSDTGAVTSYAVKTFDPVSTTTAWCWSGTNPCTSWKDKNNVSCAEINRETALCN